MKSFTIRYEFVATCAKGSRSKQTNSATKPNTLIDNRLHNYVVCSYAKHQRALKHIICILKPSAKTGINPRYISLC